MTPTEVAEEFLPFARPDITEDEVEAVTTALRSGWITTGPSAAAFEREFADFLGPDLHAVAVNSATAGLHLALEALGIGPGDEVLVPTWTFTATAEVVRYLGATPVLVDVEPGSLNLDFEAAARAVTPRTRAIIPSTSPAFRSRGRRWRTSLLLTICGSSKMPRTPSRSTPSHAWSETVPAML